MTALEIYEEYLKLDEVEKIKFERMMNSNKKTQEDRVKEIRSQVLNKMSEIKNPDGTPYFDQEFLKNKLGL